MSIQTKDALGDQIRETRDEANEVRDEIASIVGDLMMLFRKEAELASAELGEQAALTRTGAIAGGAAAILALLTLVFGGLALTFGLAEAMPLWAAALITTGIMLVLALVGALVARSTFRRFSIVPRRTIDSVSEDMRWARRQLTFNGR